MYKKYGVLVVLLILMAITVNARITGYQTAAQTKEVDVVAGWNLVAFPKAIITSVALGNLQPAIYQFKDAKWERFTVQQFEPNTAYFMDFMQAGKIKVPIATSQPNVQLKQGWNAIGVSVDVKIKDGKIKSTGQEYALKNKVTALYVFNAEQQKWSPVTINDDVSLVPGKGYLLYSTQAGELSFEKEVLTTTFTGDDFEDGDYTKNPEWKAALLGIPVFGRLSYLKVENGRLVGVNSLAMVPSEQAFGTWEFDVFIGTFKSYIYDYRKVNVSFIALNPDIGAQDELGFPGYVFELDDRKARIRSSKGIIVDLETEEYITKDYKVTKEKIHVKITRVKDVITLSVDSIENIGYDNTKIDKSNNFRISGGPGTFVVDNIKLSPISQTPVACTPGEKMCNKKRPVLCNSDGTWQNMELCEFSCNPTTGQCQGCQEGELRCKQSNPYWYQQRVEKCVNGVFKVISGDSYKVCSDEKTKYSCPPQPEQKNEVRIKTCAVKCMNPWGCIKEYKIGCVNNKEEYTVTLEDGGKQSGSTPCEFGCDTINNKCKERCEENEIICRYGSVTKCIGGKYTNWKPTLCNKNILYYCAEDAKTLKQFSCASGCKDDDCACKEGEMRCNPKPEWSSLFDEKKQVYGMYIHVNQKCIDGKFKKFVCDGNKLNICVDGTSKLTPSTCQYGCNEDLFTCNCKNGEKRCSTQSPGTYNEADWISECKNGKWETIKGCGYKSNAYCDTKTVTCVTKPAQICQPGKSECNIAQMRTCDSNGQWGSWQKCSVPKKGQTYCGYYGCDDNKGKHYDKCITSC